MGAQQRILWRKALPTSHLELVQVYFLTRASCLLSCSMSSEIVTMAQTSGENGDLNSAVSILSENNCKIEKAGQPASPYSAFSPRKRQFILGVVTAAGFFGPLSGAIYLPALPLFENIFTVSATVINATVSVYMVVFAVVVSYPPRVPRALPRG
jgi:hypothetical protein